MYREVSAFITEVYLRASVAVRAIDDFVGEPVKKHPPTIERKAFFFCVQGVEHSIDAKRILNRWSFRFPLGLTFGLVGTTGRGKSSLMSLLLGQEAAIGTKTGIVISHNADVVDLLSDRVVYIPGDGTPRTGTHEELARDDPSYRAIRNVDSITDFGHL